MKNRKIAVFANGWSNEFIQLTLDGIREEAARDGVDVFAFVDYIFWGDTGKQNKCQLNIFHLPNPAEFDGAIMMTNTFNLPDEQQRICALFQRAGVPMVSTEVKVEGMPYLGTSNYEGLHELAEHLVTVHGVKDVVYMAGIEGNNECAIRKQALIDVLTEHGLTLRDTLRGDFGFYNASMSIKRWLEAGNKLPDAIVCANDHMAQGVSSMLHSHGIEVPQDVIVTGFDYILEAKTSFPLMTTVSRRWDRLGTLAYKELVKQIEKPDPNVEHVYASKFIPSESCGCKPGREAIHLRLEKVRNYYLDKTKSDMEDIFLQNMRVRMAKVENKEQFFEGACDTLGVNEFLGPDFCICTEPTFFELNDEMYPNRIRGYSKSMDVIYEKRAGKSISPYSFRTKSVVPGYHKVPGESNLYILVPLNNQEFIIGYLIIKNTPNALYDMSLRKWVLDLNSLFITIRQYIFSQQANRKLKEVYMTDFLTGMYNRTGCEREIFGFIAKEREAGRSTVLLFADINRMKTINDVYGHLNGDLAIKATADAMRKSLPEGWLFGRYGGDEFVAVGACHNEEAVPTMRENLASSMKNFIEGYNLSFKLTASVGWNIIHPTDEGEIEDFIRLADESMYEEKEKAHRLLDAEG